MKLLLFILMVLSPIIYAKNTKIMPLGDSITYDDAYSPPPKSLAQSYRSYLWYDLSNHKYDVDFVGSIKNTGWAVRPKFDTDQEGHPGWRSYDISNIVYNRLVSYPADIILLHIGSNE